MPEVAHLAEDGVKDVHVRGEIDPGRSVICELLVRLPLIFEGVQLHPHVRRVTLPARTIATFLIRGYFKPDNTLSALFPARSTASFL